MPFKLPDGRTISEDTPFTYNGIQYPANWLRLSTPEEKEAIGLEEITPPPYYDQRFYWGYDQDGNIIPKDHTQLVEQWINQTKTTAGTLLSPTDWMIVRQIDNGTEIDPTIKSWREQVRTDCVNKISKINETTTTEELATYITGPEYSVWSTLS